MIGWHRQHNVRSVRYDATSSSAPLSQGHEDAILCTVSRFRSERINRLLRVLDLSTINEEPLARRRSQGVVRGLIVP